jgi:hypothetical protein
MGEKRCDVNTLCEDQRFRLVAPVTGDRLAGIKVDRNYPWI